MNTQLCIAFVPSDVMPSAHIVFVIVVCLAFKVLRPSGKNSNSNATNTTC